MNTQKITEKYLKLHTELLYLQACELLDLLTDNEYADLTEEHPDIFAQPFTEDVLENPHLLTRLISVFTETLEKRELTAAELEKLSDSELESYILRLIKLPNQSYTNILAAINELNKGN